VTSPGWASQIELHVAPGVHRMPTPMPGDGLSAVNVYAIETPDGVTLIDSGWDIPESRVALMQGLGKIDATPSDITRFLVTHAHQDHYAQAVAVRRDFGTRVSLGLGEKPALAVLRSSIPPDVDGHLAGLVVLGAQHLAERLRPHVVVDPLSHLGWEAPDDWLVPGPVAIASNRWLEAVETPGHTAGHLVFHDLEGELLFAGDHVLPTITPSLTVPPLEGGSLAAFLRSLALVRARPDARLLPAHGHVANSVHERVDQLLDHHRLRLDEMARAVAAGACSASEVATAVPWTRRGKPFAELDLFAGLMAVHESAAHLDYLVSEGRLSVTLIDGVRCYT